MKMRKKKYGKEEAYQAVKKAFIMSQNSNFHRCKKLLVLLVMFCIFKVIILTSYYVLYLFIYLFYFYLFFILKFFTQGYNSV